MKKTISLIVVMFLLYAGCAQQKTINNVTYDSVGLISMNLPSNLNNNYSKNIRYEVCWGNVIWGCVLFETVIAPIYFFGFSMFDPVSQIDTLK